MIIFFHGFAATGYGSSKAALLREAFDGVSEVITPTYPCEQPDATYDLLKKTVEDNLKPDEPLLIGGISFGGFWARRMAKDFPQAKVLLINPALDGIETLSKYEGENTNWDSGDTFTVTQQAIDAVGKYNVTDDNVGQSFLVMLAEDDDVVPPQKAHDVFGKNIDAKVVSVEKAGHRFECFADYVEEIIRFYDA